MLLLCFPTVALIVSLNLFSCGGSGGGGASPVNSSFGGGIVTTSIGTVNDEAHALVVQSDEKLVAAGYSNNGTQNVFALVRYLPNGKLDSSFGAGGIVTTAIGSLDDKAFALAIQKSDEKLVVAGYSYNGTQNVFALARYNINVTGKTDGTLDTSFGTGGIVTTAIGSLDDKAFALAIQSDNKLVVAGYSLQGTQYKFALVRYNTDGTLDTGFGTGGIVTTAIGAIDDEAFALAIQSDGKLVAAGRSKINTTNGNVYEFALVRYNTGGSLDTTTFNPAGTPNPGGTPSIIPPGIVTTVIGNGGDDEALALAIQPSDGKLVAAGYSNNGVQNVFALARYNTNGSLDTTGFGRQGIVTTAIVTTTSPIGINSVAYALGIDSTGKLVAAGYSTTNNTSQQRAFALARYNPIGSLDTTFNSTGKATTAIGTVDDEAFALVVQSENSVVTAGRSYNKTMGAYEFALVSYLP